ncbi:MAG: PLP-dependent cysteine synthase family protein [Actinomycetales bacterium]
MTIDIAAATPADLRARPRIALSVEDLIGNTPLIDLTATSHPGARLLAKVEAANPLSSVKDRAAVAMLDGAERAGRLVPGKSTVVEATSGNTGIALAALASVRGYRCIVVMPDTATPERVSMLRLLGARVVLTPAAQRLQGAIDAALHLCEVTPDSWFCAQHLNPDNPRAHEETTGPEIWRDCQGVVDVLVAGVGTGGTLSGTARYLRRQNPDLHVVAVEPYGSPVLSTGVGGTHAIAGLNGGFVAPTTDVDLIDEVLTVTDARAREAARTLAREHALVVGVSSGAAMAAARTVAARAHLIGKTVVTILPDTGERYLSLWTQEQADV